MSIFSKIKLPRVKRSAFNLSYSNKLSCEMGHLVPIFLEKVYPGDIVKHQHRINSNVATLASQLMQEFDIRTEYFFVPSRLLWENFENFLKGGNDGVNNSYVHPFFKLSSFYSIQNGTEIHGSVFDYLGYKYMKSYTPSGGVQSTEDINVDALPFFAYMKVFADYYADENLQNPDFSPAADGNQTLSAISQAYQSYQVPMMSAYSIQDIEFWYPLFRNYRKDYFTSALPFAQKGQVVTIPIDGVGDVDFTMSDAQGNPVSINGYSNIQGTAPTASIDNVSLREGSVGYVVSARAHDIQATATVEDFRVALRVQEWLEKNARSGTRANEMIFSHFGVRSQDARLQRAEFIQGNLQVYNVGNIYTTAQDTSNTGLPGQRYSVVNSSGVSAPFKYKVKEHGYVLGLMTCYPTASYMDGIRRQFLELDKFDYMWPEFAHLGEQPIYNCEVKTAQEWQIGASAKTLKPFDTWGYTPRYSHLKTHNNEVHGQFLDNLNMFHDARSFDNVQAPILDADFISINPIYNGLNRVFNVNAFGSQFHHWFFDIYHDTKMIRPLPYFDTPRIL